VFGLEKFPPQILIVSRSLVTDMYSLSRNITCQDSGIATSSMKPLPDLPTPTTAGNFHYFFPNSEIVFNQEYLIQKEMEIAQIVSFTCTIASLNSFEILCALR